MAAAMSACHRKADILRVFSGGIDGAEVAAGGTGIGIDVGGTGVAVGADVAVGGKGVDVGGIEVALGSGVSTLAAGETASAAPGVSASACSSDVGSADGSADKAGKLAFPSPPADGLLPSDPKTTSSRTPRANGQGPEKCG